MLLSILVEMYHPHQLFAAISLSSHQGEFFLHCCHVVARVDYTFVIMIFVALKAVKNRGHNKRGV